jgi:hypothetical protein
LNKLNSSSVVSNGSGNGSGNGINISNSNKDNSNAFIKAGQDIIGRGSIVTGVSRIDHDNDNNSNSKNYSYNYGKYQNTPQFKSPNLENIQKELKSANKKLKFLEELERKNELRTIQELEKMKTEKLKKHEIQYNKYIERQKDIDKVHGHLQRINYLYKDQQKVYSNYLMESANRNLVIEKDSRRNFNQNNSNNLHIHKNYSQSPMKVKHIY